MVPPSSHTNGATAVDERPREMTDQAAPLIPDFDPPGLRHCSVRRWKTSEIGCQRYQHVVLGGAPGSRMQMLPSEIRPYPTKWAQLIFIVPKVALLFRSVLSVSLVSAPVLWKRAICKTSAPPSVSYIRQP